MRTVQLIVAGLFAMLIGSTAQAAACDGFTDVDSGNTTYCSAVTYLKDHGITLGCTGSTYCPNDYVTRLQMALFLQRMSIHDASNHVTGEGSTVAGGIFNTVSNSASVVGGGSTNVASGYVSTVTGGYANLASGFQATVLGGTGNTASGLYSLALGGNRNTASGSRSIAMGEDAVADDSYCIVIALWGNSEPMNCIGSPSVVRIGDLHGFSVDYYSQRPDGGGTRWVGIGDLVLGQTISVWNGAYLSDGGAWINSSDRNAKTDVALIDPQTVLDKVAAMPIATWRYKTENDQVHLGPMAQDFRAAFGLGADDKHIATIDEGGVALAAIQGLNAKLEAQVAALTTKLSGMQHQLDAIVSNSNP